MTTEGKNESKTSEAARNGAQARTAAVKLLINLHRDEFNEIYAREAAARGVRTRAATKEEKIAKLQAQLKELQG